MQKKKLIFQPTNCINQEELLQYLSGNMEEASRYRVENHLLDCPLCSEAMEGFVSESVPDLDKDIADLKNAVIKKGAEHSGSSNQSYWTLNRIAAVILFLIISGAGFFYWNAQRGVHAFLAEFQSSKELIESVRGEEGFPDGSEFSEGIGFYRSENYRESLLFFENLLELQPENSVAHYYLGMSALNLGELEKAIEGLTYARINSDKYYEDATWHLALANLGTGNVNEAKVLITDLLKIEGGFYSEKAQRLLKKIEEK